MNFIKFAFLFLLMGFLPVFSIGAEQRVLILGDSLTKGYGLDPELAFPALLQKKIDDVGIKDWIVMNGGVSGDTTAGGLRRVTWLLRKKVDILVIALGGNDGLRGIDPAEAAKNLQAIIDKSRAANPGMKIVIAGMQMPDNLGKDYITKFREVFPAVAEKNSVILIPFLLEGVGGVEELNQPDQIHPNAKGQEIIAETVWKVLKAMF